MIIDSSAICAIILEETDGPYFQDALSRVEDVRISAFSVFESAVVLESRRGADGGAELDTFLERESIEIVPVTTDQVAEARRAYREYGKGNHSAGLNLGDCMSYALAAMTGELLLFKGEDFSQTDVRAELE